MEEEIVKVGKRGQIPLPKKIREKEGIEEGTFLELSRIGGVLTLRRVEKKPDALDLFKEVGKALQKEGYSGAKARELVERTKKKAERNHSRGIS